MGGGIDTDHSGATGIGSSRLEPIFLELSLIPYGAAGKVQSSKTVIHCQVVAMQVACLIV